MFYDQYKNPTLQGKYRSVENLEEEARVQKALKRQQYQINKLTIKPLQTNSQVKLKKQLEIHEHKKSIILPQLNKNILTPKPRHVIKKNFALDYTSCQQIKNKLGAFRNNAKIVLNNPMTKKLNTEQELFDKLQNSFSHFKEIIAKYRYSLELFNEALNHFVYLSKISSFLSIIRKDPQTINSQKAIERLFEMITFESTATISPNDYSNYGSLIVNVKIVKAFYSKLAKLPYNIYKRVLTSINITNTDILIEEFMRIRYYLIDMQATDNEYITFSKKILNPDNNNKAEDVIKVLKVILIRENEDNSKREELLNALISSFEMCKIIDAEKFNSEAFVNAYTKKRMNVRSLIKIMLF